MNNYAAARTPAGVAGNIRAAPMGNNIAFVQRPLPQRCWCINGVNSETNSHDDGTRAHATGMLAMDYPNMSELYCLREHGKGVPLPVAQRRRHKHERRSGPRRRRCRTATRSAR